MDIAVRTGETKSGSGTTLAALSFTSSHGEHACLLLHGEAESRDGKTFEQECATIMQQSLLGSEGEPWSRLDGALKELNGLLKGFLVSGTLENIHAVVVLVDRDGTLHVSAAGRGEGYLVRGGSASQVTEYTKGKPISAFVHISTGSLEPGDTVILSTQRLLRTLTPAQLASLSHPEHQFINEVVDVLEGEKETAALATIHVPGGADHSESSEEKESSSRSRAAALPSRRGGRRHGNAAMAMTRDMWGHFITAARSATKVGATMGKRGAVKMSKGSSGLRMLQEKGMGLMADLKDPKRKRRAHLLLFAAAMAALIVLYLIVSLSTSSQRSKTRTELAELMTQITEEIQTADNRRLAGDMDGANSLLARAEERAKQVMDNESGYFRAESLDLLDKIRSKSEEINNILRVPARVLVNMSSKNSGVSAQGLIGLGEGEFLVYDRQNAYRVLLNRLDEPKRLVEDDLILQGADFARYKSQVFTTTGNSVIELSANQIIPMKTEDPAGWMTGKDIETYLRYLYILAPDKQQIFKYERLSNRYAAPVQYNVNGDLTGAIDMVIDASAYVLKENGTVLKLLRGETQPFVIRHAPDDVLKNVTKMFKSPESNFYFLDPKKPRVIVTTDGGGTGESSYVKQYILEGEQIGTLQDLYVDPEESHLYVLDEKRVYVIDLATQ
ncbi:hypothetical protein EXS70_01035 [Candidatus Peribacteria bacterium]|nr:hypothetical protein [Candidatus Peribacteria bacterium]